MRVEVYFEADLEISQAISYYEKRQPSLGHCLYQEYLRGLEWVLKNPEVPPLRGGKYRRYNLKRFPYGIVYVTRGDVLYIIAFAHGRRKPAYWINRPSP